MTGAKSDVKSQVKLKQILNFKDSQFCIFLSEPLMKVNIFFIYYPVPSKKYDILMSKIVMLNVWWQNKEKNDDDGLN